MSGDYDFYLKKESLLMITFIFVLLSVSIYSLSNVSSDVSNEKKLFNESEGVDVVYQESKHNSYRIKTEMNLLDHRTINKMDVIWCNKNDLDLNGILDIILLLNYKNPFQNENIKKNSIKILHSNKSRKVINLEKGKCLTVFFLNETSSLSIPRESSKVVYYNKFREPVITVFFNITVKVYFKNHTVKYIEHGMYHEEINYTFNNEYTNYTTEKIASINNQRNQYMLNTLMYISCLSLIIANIIFLAIFYLIEERIKENSH